MYLRFHNIVTFNMKLIYPLFDTTKRHVKTNLTKGGPAKNRKLPNKIY